MRPHSKVVSRHKGQWESKGGKGNLKHRLAMNEGSMTNWTHLGSNHPQHQYQGEEPDGDPFPVFVPGSLGAFDDDPTDGSWAAWPLIFLP